MKEYLLKNKAKIMAILSAFLMLSLTLSIVLIVVYNAPKAPTVAVDGDGNDYNSNQFYDLPNNLIFTKSESTDTSASVNLQATIKPDTATNKRLNWSANFLNIGSNWASGKVIKDYITIDVNEADNTKATVNCLNAFGEKIEISAVSVDNPNARAVCTLDYAQRVIGAKLYFGEWEMNINDDTEFKFNVNSNGAALGGIIRCDYILSDTYTIVDNFTLMVKARLYCPEKCLIPTECDRCMPLSLKNTAMLHSIATITIKPNPDGIFEQNDFLIENTSTYLLTGDFNNDGTIGIDEYFDRLSKAQQIDYLSNITQPYLNTLDLIITGQYTTFKAYTDIKCTGYIDYAAVSEVNFPNKNIVI